MLITLQFEGKEGPDFPPLVIPVSVPFFSWLPSFNQPFVECEIFSILHQRLLTLKRVLLISTMDNKHSTLHFYHHHLPNLSHTSIIQQRLQLFNSFNGDAFYPLSVWPQEFKLIFWTKQISDKGHIQTVFIFNWQWLFTTPDFALDPHITTLDQRQKLGRKTCSSTRFPTQQHGQQVAYLVLLRFTL